MSQVKQEITPRSASQTAPLPALDNLYECDACSRMVPRDELKSVSTGGTYPSDVTACRTCRGEEEE